MRSESMDLLTEVDRAIASALIGLNGIRAVSIGGSRAVGMDDSASDTDLYAWQRGPLVAAALRQEELAGLADDGVTSFEVFGPEDHFHVDGRLVEVVHLDLDEIEGQVRRARTEGLGGEVCATAFLHTAYASVPIPDPYAELDRLHADLTTFPEATRASSSACRSWPTSSPPSCAERSPATGQWSFAARRAYST